MTLAPEAPVRDPGRRHLPVALIIELIYFVKFIAAIIQKNTMRFEFYRVHDQLAFVAAIVLSDDGLGI